MSTSNSYTFSLSGSAIIDMALKEINAIDETETADASQYAYCVNKLNMMLKKWQADGIKIWKRFDATLFPALNQYKYSIGSVSGTDNCTKTYVSTTTTTSTANAATSIVVSSVTGMSVNDNIGITLDDGTRFWTTIQSISTLTITLNAATTTTAALGNRVVTYTSKINRPLSVINARTVDLDNNNTTLSMKMLSFDEYKNMPIKSIIGRPIDGYYEKTILGSIPHSGTFFIFNQPASVDVVIEFTYYDVIQDIVNPNDDLDFPQEWMEPLVLGLAARIARHYGKIDVLPDLRQEATMSYQELKNWDADDTDLCMGYDYP